MRPYRYLSLGTVLVSPYIKSSISGFGGAGGEQNKI